MKKIILFAVCGLLVFNVKAQSNTDEIALIQSMYGIEKKQMIIDLMKLTEAETPLFWPVYDKYEAERKELGKVRMALIIDYSKNYTTMTNEKATELINESIVNHQAISKLQLKAFKEMSKAITAMRAAQFIQFENFLETSIRSELSKQLPFIELKK